VKERETKASLSICIIIWPKGHLFEDLSSHMIWFSSRVWSVHPSGMKGNSFSNYCCIYFHFRMKSIREALLAKLIES
jgi:hypothetical protein